jgi:plastocyanin
MDHAKMDTTRRAPQRTLAANEIGIDNFSFTPAVLTVPRGTTVTWINDDDVPHLLVSTTLAFGPSPILDTNQRFSFRFATAGSFDYFCSVHPKMTGRVVVTP